MRIKYHIYIQGIRRSTVRSKSALVRAGACRVAEPGDQRCRKQTRSKGLRSSIALTAGQFMRATPFGTAQRARYEPIGVWATRAAVQALYERPPLHSRCTPNLARQPLSGAASWTRPLGVLKLDRASIYGLKTGAEARPICRRRDLKGAKADASTRSTAIKHVKADHDSVCSPRRPTGTPARRGWTPPELGLATGARGRIPPFDISAR